VIGAAVAGVGVLTGWGHGLSALPESARRAAGGRRVIPLAAPAGDGDRFRRATRECRLAVGAVQAMLDAAERPRGSLRGDGTALVYVTAACYGASNRSFVESDVSAGGVPGAALHFPYTAPSAVPGEVAIEFGLTGPYLILLGGAPSTVEAFWYAGRLLDQGQVERALVLAVETYEECADLHARARWLVGRPLVEAAACALLERAPRADGERGGADAAGGASEPSRWTLLARRRAGETMACEPLIALALAQGAGALPAVVSGRWRTQRSAVAMRGARAGAAAEGRESHGGQ
jgi:hypothetical protein